MLRKHLHDLGIRMHADVTVTALEAGRVSGETVYEDPWQLGCDGVVLVTQRVSDESLYLELAADPGSVEGAGIQGVHRIGDCIAPQLIADVIWDGHRMGREIDSDDPSLPLPHLRERPGLEPDPVLLGARAGV
jgi:dimethylamine/trimethylamine dehydrogenase